MQIPSKAKIYLTNPALSTIFVIKLQNKGFYVIKNRIRKFLLDKGYHLH